MTNLERRGSYITVCLLALAFGWIEASVVVYLREIAMRARDLQGASGLPNVQVVLVSLPGLLVGVEVVRSACTLALLGAVGWLAGRRIANRIGAFLLAFGIWDIIYYAALRVVTGWPESIGSRDILFLIPAPWVAPVWAPLTVATVFVVAGSYLFWTPDRERRYRWPDISLLIATAALALAAFLAGSTAVTNNRLPERFPLFVFWSGVIFGIVSFVAFERREAVPREAVREDASGPSMSPQVHTLAPPADAASTTWSATPSERTLESPPDAHDVRHILERYRDAESRLDALLDDANEIAEHFERLAHGLSTHPRRLIVGLPEENLEDLSEWEIVPRDVLPSIDQVKALTDDIRAESRRVEELRERLILLGHPDVLQHPHEFFQ